MLLADCNLFAGENKLQFEIVPFDICDESMKEQLCVMIRDDQEMAKILDTNEESMRQNYLSCPDLQYDVQSFVCRSTDRSAKIYGFIQCSQHDEFYECAELVTIQEKLVGFVNGIAVHKDYRGCGVALALLNHFEEICKINGMQQLMLFTGVDNDKAIRAYTRYGFKIDPAYSTHLGITMIKLIHEN